MARYCDAKDLRALIPDEFRDAALADSSGGNEADAGLLNAVLEGACAEVDALIEGRVRLPLSAVPAKLRVAAANIALEMLYIRRGRELPGSAVEKVQWWRAWLSKVGEGELRLDAPDTAGRTEYPGAVATRPSITGSGRLLFGFVSWICTLALAHDVLAVGPRAWAFDVPDAEDVFENPAEMEWAAGESLELRYSGGKLGPGQVARWEVAGGTNLWIALPGAETDAAWRWSLAPTQTCLPAGRYQGRVAVYETDEGQTGFLRVAALQSIRVHRGADGLAEIAPMVVRLDDYALLSWVSNQLHLVAVDIATNAEAIAGLEAATNAIVGAVAAVVSRIDGLWGEMPGGWRYPDYFTASARPGGEPVEAVALSTNTTLNAVETLRQTTSVRGWILEAEVTRQGDFGAGVAWELGPEAEGLWAVEGDAVVPAGATAGNVAPGDVVHATGRLGGFEREVELAVTVDNVSSSGLWQWDGWVPNSLIGEAWRWSESYADRVPGGTGHVRVWPEGYGSGTNLVPAGWAETWVPCANHVFSCVSYHTDKSGGAPGGVYMPVTLVTPRHGIVANHWKPAIGSNVYWVGSSGAIYTNRVVAYRNLRGDLTVARLAEPMDAMFEDSEVIRDITLPYLLPDDYEAWFYGCEHGGAGCPGVPCVSLDAVERAYMTYWRCATALTAKRASDPRSFTVLARGAGTPHGRRAAAVGGDSGSPTFLLTNNEVVDDPGGYATDRPVLLGCFHWASTPETGIGKAGGPIPLVGEVNAAIEEWGDEERAESAEACFEALGYEKYNPGMVPWQ